MTEIPSEIKIWVTVPPSSSRRKPSSTPQRTSKAFISKRRIFKAWSRSRRNNCEKQDTERIPTARLPRTRERIRHAGKNPRVKWTRKKRGSAERNERRKKPGSKKRARGCNNNCNSNVGRCELAENRRQRGTGIGSAACTRRATPKTMIQILRQQQLQRAADQGANRCNMYSPHNSSNNGSLSGRRPQTRRSRVQ